MVELQTGRGLGVFSAQQAYELYDRLLGPISEKLNDIKHAYVVPDLRILDLPIAALVTTKPQKPLINPDDATSFRTTKWLIDQFAITVLPSISSLVYLRSLEQNDFSQEGFFGIGNPVFEGRETNQAVSEPASRSRLAGISRISLLQPLPEAALELKAIGGLLAKDGGTILLGEQATETAVKQAELHRYKVVSFATHGVIANEIPGVREPGLILTPPKISTEEDDGILTSSEISRLKLKADWVILSACNTAAGGGGANNAPLEGLARSFFYAGAKSLLVSHWAVDSVSTVELTTRTVESATRYRSSFSISHQKAMQAMIQSGNPTFSHPSAWAAFFVVGVASTSK
jgi:CHAT domain-containing protein